MIATSMVAIIAYTVERVLMVLNLTNALADRSLLDHIANVCENNLLPSKHLMYKTIFSRYMLSDRSSLRNGKINSIQFLRRKNK